MGVADAGRDPDPSEGRAGDRHPGRVDAIRAAVSEVSGLAIAGAAFRGVGVPACIRDAQHAVDALLG